jgi:threonine dehydrogenase-like Zn-dependent dehydrogenase
MTVRFQAAVLRSYEDPFAVEEVTLHTEPADGEILVEIAGCGMCRTDLAVQDQLDPLGGLVSHFHHLSSTTRRFRAWANGDLYSTVLGHTKIFCQLH